MKRSDFLKSLGILGITAISSKTGLSKEHIEKNIQIKDNEVCIPAEQKDFYTFGDLIPGQEHVLNTTGETYTDDDGKKHLIPGWIRWNENEVKKYWGKNFYLKFSKKRSFDYKSKSKFIEERKKDFPEYDFMKYEDVLKLKGFNGWDAIRLNKETYTKNNIVVYDYDSRNLVLELNTNCIKEAAKILKLREDKVIRAYEIGTHYNNRYFFKHKGHDLSEKISGLYDKPWYDVPKLKK